MAIKPIIIQPNYDLKESTIQVIVDNKTHMFLKSVNRTHNTVDSYTDEYTWTENLYEAKLFRGGVNVDLMQLDKALNWSYTIFNWRWWLGNKNPRYPSVGITSLVDWYLIFPKYAPAWLANSKNGKFATFPDGKDLFYVFPKK